MLCCAGAAVGDGARARGRAHALDRARRRLRRPRLRGEDGGGAARRAGASSRPGCGSLRAGGSVALRQLLAGGAAMVAVGGAWPLLDRAHAGGRPAVGVGHERQQIWSLIFGYNGLGRLSGQAGGPQAFGGGGGGGGGGRSAARRACCGCSTPRSAARPAGCSASRSSAGLGIAVADPAAPRRTQRTGWLIAVGGACAHLRRRVQRRLGHLPPLLRLPARAVRRRAGGRRRGPGAARAGWSRRRGRARSPIAGGVATSSPCSTTTPASWSGCRRCSSPPACSPSAASRCSAGAHLRTSLAVGLAVLFIAPAAWAAQTLGHATSGTFPAGGPASRPPAASAAARAASRGRRRLARARAGRPPGAAHGPPPAGAAAGSDRRGRRRPRRRRQPVDHRGAEPTSRPTAAARSRSRARTAARRPRSSTPAPTSSRSAASPAARARSPRDWLADRVAVRRDPLRAHRPAAAGLGNDSRVGSSDVMADGRRRRAARSARSAGSTTSPARPRRCGGVQETVRDAAFDVLRRRGLTTIFANPGSTEIAVPRRPARTTCASCSRCTRARWSGWRPAGRSAAASRRS